MNDLYRLVTSGEEFRQYELFWTYHGVLPEGVSSVVVDDDDEAVEFFVPVTIDYESARREFEEHVYSSSWYMPDDFVTVFDKMLAAALGGQDE